MNTCTQALNGQQSKRSMIFATLGLSGIIARPSREREQSRRPPVQIQTIPVVSSGRNRVASVKTNRTRGRRSATAMAEPVTKLTIKKVEKVKKETTHFRQALTFSGPAQTEPGRALAKVLTPVSTKELPAPPVPPENTGPLITSAHRAYRGCRCLPTHQGRITVTPNFLA